MVMTTWDGHLRIDHLPDAGMVTLTLVTLEAEIEARLHAGLAVGFVTADPHGPPSFVAVALREGRIPADIAVLLGPRVAGALADLVAEGLPGRWLQLDLVEIDDLAAAWAPYRLVVLETVGQAPMTRGVLGAWASELWTCLAVPDWRDALRAPIGPAPVVRGTEGPLPEPAAQGTWQLPDELAVAIGVAPEVAWSLRLIDRDAVEIDLRVRSTGPPRAVLQVGLDDGSQRWVPFETDNSGGLRARLVSSGERVSVRFRSGSEGVG